MPDEAIILAGGLGTRLRAVVSDVPKPLAPVAGRPFLAWLLDSLAAQGIRRVILSSGYMAETLRERLGEAHAGMVLEHHAEAAPLGTGGAVWAALPLLSGPRGFVLNGDTWLGAPLAPLAAEAPAADLVLALRAVPDRARYGAVRIEGNQVLGMAEKGGEGPGLVNGGLYVIRRDLPAKRPMPAAFGLEQDILSRPGTLDIRGHVTDAPFLDIGTPEDYARAQGLIPAWAANT